MLKALEAEYSHSVTVVYHSHDGVRLWLRRNRSESPASPRGPPYIAFRATELRLAICVGYRLRVVPSIGSSSIKGGLNETFDFDPDACFKTDDAGVNLLSAE
jgi:hypothetical protein